MNSKLSISLALSIGVHIFVLLILSSGLDNKLAINKYNILYVDFYKQSTKISKDLADSVSIDKHEQPVEKSSLNQLQSPRASKEISSLAPPIIYYKLSELDQKPSLIGEIDNNPIELRKYSVGGHITIRLWINEDGNVIKTEIIKSELPEEFNKSALNTFQQAKFLPGLKNNRPVKSVAKVMIQYGAINSTN